MSYIKRILKFIKVAAANTLKAVAAAHILLGMFVLIVSIYLINNNPGYTSLILYRKYIHKHKINPLKYISGENIPDVLKQMVIATEDYRFYRHSGIDIEAMKRAYIINKKMGYRMYGGSTITQQLARTLFLFPKKILLRKYIEILISMEMELILSKDRILELYLNYCELGKGLFGVGAASEYYFKKDVTELGTDGMARLVTILASPILHSPYTFSKKKFLAYRYYFIKFRYYSFLKFHGQAD